MLTFNGKPFNPGDFGKALEKQAVRAVIAQVREKFGAIRHPETGEFPTVFATGETLTDLRMRIEASPELIDLIKLRTQGEVLSQIDLVPRSGLPHVFLSYGWEDRELAEKIASALQSNGIETWWAEWCMSAGDSLRQKIDQGIIGCTHFVVLLTPQSISKPWVNQEMDAGLIRKLNDQAKFIPLRHNLSHRDLPPLLSGMLSPEVDASTSDIQQLINDMHGVTRKPPLGSPPSAVRVSRAIESRYSAAATAVAEVFVRDSQHALSHEPQMPLERMMERTGLSKDDVIDAIHELTGLADLYFGDTVWPRPTLFAEFDQLWMPWRPADDAMKLAADILSDSSFPSSLSEIGARYGWAPRRLNPAVSYLKARNLAMISEATGTQPWITAWIQKTDETRRFAKSRQ
jgi:hypothetical protein